MAHSFTHLKIFGLLRPARGMCVLSTRGSQAVRILRTEGMGVLSTGESGTVRILRTEGMGALSTGGSQTECTRMYIYLGVGYEIGRAVHMNK